MEGYLFFVQREWYAPGGDMKKKKEEKKKAGLQGMKVAAWVFRTKGRMVMLEVRESNGGWATQTSLYSDRVSRASSIGTWVYQGSLGRPWAHVHSVPIFAGEKFMASTCIRGSRMRGNVGPRSWDQGTTRRRGRWTGVIGCAGLAGLFRSCTKREDIPIASGPGSRPAHVPLLPGSHPICKYLLAFRTTVLYVPSSHCP